MYLIEGRSDEQKKLLIEKVSAAMSEALGAPLENTRVWIQDVPKAQWGIGGKTAKELGR
ncbi:MAG: 4-oxalocrotonate tautomerase family protein [Dechloromonas sp.]|nr:4-oxalocrotonate tautomerase family protein [Dechloromonas sp.]